MRGPRAIDHSLRIKMAMGRALKECPDSARVVAARMSDLMGREITADALYAYTAPSKTDHDIGISRFVAFIRATGCDWLWRELLAEEGLAVVDARDRELAEIGRLHLEQRRLQKKMRRIERHLEGDEEA